MLEFEVRITKLLFFHYVLLLAVNFYYPELNSIYFMTHEILGISYVQL